MLLSLLFYKLGNQGWVRLNDLPKITQPARPRAMSVDLGFSTLNVNFSHDYLTVYLWIELEYGS